MVEQLTVSQRSYLETGTKNESGRLSLFNEFGAKFPPTTVKACLEKGFAEPWFANPMQPGWTVCHLTEAGRSAVEKTIN